MDVLQAVPLRWVPVAVTVDLLPSCLLLRSLDAPFPLPSLTPSLDLKLGHPLCSCHTVELTQRVLHVACQKCHLTLLYRGNHRIKTSSSEKIIKEGEVKSFPPSPPLPEKAAPLLIPTAGLSSCRVDLVSVVSSQLKEFPSQIVSL